MPAANQKDSKLQVAELGENLRRAKKEREVPTATEQAINSQLLLVWLIKEKLLPLTPGGKQAEGHGTH